MSQRIVVSVINDLVTDQRVHRACTAMQEVGLSVHLVGRVLPASPPMNPRSYTWQRMKLIFTRGALFYAEYNLRLCWKLLFIPADYFWSNDLDTLPANFLAARIRRKPLVYDSHEYFTEVPELEHNRFAKKVWKWFERTLVPRVKYCITVNDSIAGFFARDYGKKFVVVRNVPMPLPDAPQQATAFPGETDVRILILQGSGINVHRGSEELLEAMHLLDERYVLWVIGSGDVIQTLRKMAEDIPERVRFFPRMPYAEMMEYTRKGHLGMSLDKSNNLNYQYSLPNKLFDYIQAGIPVLASGLPEVSRIIDTYSVGYTVTKVEPQQLAQAIQAVFENEVRYKEMQANCKTAARELHWDNEKKILTALLNRVMYE